MRSALGREEMMDRLLEVFRRDGVEGASVVDLMQAVGLQKGSLYHHFPRGKTEIAEAVLAHVERLFEAMVFSPLREAATAAEGVATMCRALEVYFAQGHKVCLPALIGLGPTRDQFGTAIEGFFHRWIKALADAFIKGGMPVDAAMLLAEQAIIDIQGAIVVARALGQPEPFLRAMNRVNQRARLS